MYKIIAVSNYGTEQVDEAGTLKEAKRLVYEYRIAYGPTFAIFIKKNGKII